MRDERKILYFRDYFMCFYRSLDSAVQKKFDYSLVMLKMQERLSKKFVKLLREGIYELRAEHNGNIYRVFFIFDDGNVVMLFNGFQKKTQKTPENEIRRAIQIRKEYYESKQRNR